MACIHGFGFMCLYHVLCDLEEATQLLRLFSAAVIPEWILSMSLQIWCLSVIGHFSYGFPQSPMPRGMLRHDNLVWHGRKFDRKVRSLTGDHVLMWCVSGRDITGMDGAVP